MDICLEIIKSLLTVVKEGWMIRCKNHIVDRNCHFTVILLCRPYLTLAIQDISSRLFF